MKKPQIDTWRAVWGFRERTGIGQMLGSIVMKICPESGSC